MHMSVCIRQKHLIQRVEIACPFICLRWTWHTGGEQQQIFEFWLVGIHFITIARRLNQQQPAPNER